MTTSNLPAPLESGQMVGFEDFDSSDMVMPRLKFDHSNGVMVDTLSGESFTELEVVLLGQTKQRIAWPPEVSEEKLGPLCRSLNFTQGLPDIKRFPWKAAGFKPADYPEGTPLPCDGCQMKEWGTNPKNDTPWCSEQFTFALMLPAGDDWTPALLTLQRSGIKPARAYMTSFARSRTYLFTTTTKITLQQLKRGTVKYVVPQFIKGEPTDESRWKDFAEQARRIREFVQTPRDEPPPEEAKVTSPKSAAATDDDDDLDF